MVRPRSKLGNCCVLRDNRQCVNFTRPSMKSICTRRGHAPRARFICKKAGGGVGSARIKGNILVKGKMRNTVYQVAVFAEQQPRPRRLTPSPVRMPPNYASFKISISHTVVSVDALFRRSIPEMR